MEACLSAEAAAERCRGDPGPFEIDAEIARIVPLLKEGGYIPWCDHHVPPDVPLEHYLYYVERMKEMTLDPGRFKPRC